MMLTSVLAVLITTASVPAAPANAAQQPTTVTLNGCVAASSTMRNTFTLDDDGQTYVLKGVNVRDFVGQHVEVIGVTSRRLRIVGGLYPSPNVAAQGSAIDPTKAAMAAQGGPSSQSARPAIDFNVKSVRVLSEPCVEAPK
jgi:hypothetical protein